MSMKNRSPCDSSQMQTHTGTQNASINACLSFTIVSNFTDTDTYMDHGHGSQITDLWMASVKVTISKNKNVLKVCVSRKKTQVALLFCM